MVSYSTPSGSLFGEMFANEFSELNLDIKTSKDNQPTITVTTCGRKPQTATDFMSALKSATKPVKVDIIEEEY